MIDAAASIDGPVIDGASMTPDAPPPPIDASTNGLVAYYSMDSLSSGTLVDDSGNGYDGTCQAGECPTAQIGIVGNALAFDGTNDVITLPASLQTPGNFTVALWARPSASSGVQNFIAKPYDQTVADRDSWTIARSANDVAEFQSYNGTAATFLRTNSGTVVNNEWRHYAIRWNGTQRRLTVHDGSNTININDTITMLAIDGESILIGADVNSGALSFFFPGLIDEVYIYDRSLSLSEVATLAAQGGF